MEFLTEMVTNVPDGTDEATVEDTKKREAHRAAELAEQGHLLRRNADLPSLPAQLAPNAKEGGPQLVGNGNGIDLSLRHIVNWVNDS